MTINFNASGAANAITVQQALALLREAQPTAQRAQKLMGEEAGQAAAAVPAGAGSTAPPFHPQTQMLSSVHMLLALSALNPLEARRKQQIAQARRGLDGLEQLHTELMEGTVGSRTLEGLVQWLRDEKGERSALIEGDKDDRTFAGLMDEIELRVRVELAKFNIEV